MSNVNRDAVSDLLSSAESVVGYLEGDNYDLLLQSIVNVREALLPTFEHDFRSHEVTVATHFVNDVPFPRYILHPIIAWLDSKQPRWCDPVDIDGYMAIVAVGNMLRKLRELDVIEKSDPNELGFVKYRQGPQFVRFCQACGLEIEQTHS